MEMKKSWIVPVITLMVAVLFCFIYNKVKERNRNELINELSNEVLQNKLGKIKYVDLSLITEFEWDRIYFFHPYATSERINTILGKFWIGTFFTHIQSSDNITLIVFTKNRRVIQYLEYHRINGDFAYLDNDIGYSNKEAKFYIEEDGRMNYLLEDGR